MEIVHVNPTEYFRQFKYREWLIDDSVPASNRTILANSQYGQLYKASENPGTAYTYVTEKDIVHYSFIVTRRGIQRAIPTIFIDFALLAQYATKYDISSTTYREIERKIRHNRENLTGYTYYILNGNILLRSEYRGVIAVPLSTYDGCSEEYRVQLQMGMAMDNGLTFSDYAMERERVQAAINQAKSQARLNIEAIDTAIDADTVTINIQKPTKINYYE